MRVRLTIQRHALPPTNLLWKLSRSPNEAIYTIADFLEEVNELVPLESDDWGLEDYVVEYEGYEILHYTKVYDILKEDDRICIRALQTADIRVRRLSGRIQVNSDGRHLIDGVPFGRPLLRAPRRPEVALPPRKKRRTMCAGSEQDQIAYEQFLLQDRAQAPRKSPGRTIGTYEQDNGRASRARRQIGLKHDANAHDTTLAIVPHSASPKSVQFEFDTASPDELVLSHSDDSEDDADYNDNDGSESISSSGELSLLSDSSRVNVSIVDVSKVDARKSPSPTPRAIVSGGAKSASDQSSSSSDTDSTDSSSDDSSSDTSSSDSSSDDSSDSSDDDKQKDSKPSTITKNPPIPIISTKSTDITALSNPKAPGLPGQGTSATVARNLRRKDAKKLKLLKAKGVLGPEARRADLVALEGRRRGEFSAEPSCSNIDMLNKKRALLLQAVEAGGVEVTDAIVSQSDMIASSASINQIFEQDAESNEAPEEIRTAPKNKKEEQRLRNSLDAKIKLPSIKPQQLPVGLSREEIEAIAKDQSWKESLDLSAVECWNENVTLSAPPFPFVQHWHSKKGRRRRNLPTHVMEVQSDQAGEVTMVYEETDFVVSPPSKAEILDKDLPLLPTQIESLSPLSMEMCKAGAIVAFKQLEVSSATRWQPTVSNYRTAIVNAVEGQEVKLTLARRDVPVDERCFDEATGERIYSNLEMPGYDDDGQEAGEDGADGAEGRDNGQRSLLFEELLDARLVAETLDVAGVAQ